MVLLPELAVLPGSSSARHKILLLLPWVSSTEIKARGAPSSASQRTGWGVLLILVPLAWVFSRHKQWMNTVQIQT